MNRFAIQVVMVIVVVGSMLGTASVAQQTYQPHSKTLSVFLDEVSSTEWYWMEDFYGLAEGQTYEFSIEMRKEQGVSAGQAFLNVMTQVTETSDKKSRKKENHMLAERLGVDVPADGEWHKVSGQFTTIAPEGKSFVRNVNNAFRASLILYNKGKNGKAVSVKGFTGAPKYVSYNYLGEKNSDLPQILLIGDSTMMQTYPEKVKAFAEWAAIYYIPVNGGLTKASVRKYRRWVGERKWDLIYFNSGIHDLTRQNEKGQKGDDHPNRTPLDEYEENLKIITDYLKTTGTKLVWRSTTPFKPGVAGRSNGDLEAYNEKASTVMAETGIPIHDVTSSHGDELRSLSSDGVHFSKAGNQLLAQLLSDYLTENSLPGGE